MKGYKFRKIKTLVLAMLASTLGLAQVLPDSSSEASLLLRKYAGRHDTVRLRMLVEAANEKMHRQPDSALAYIKSAIALAKKNHLDAKVAEYLSLQGRAHYILGEYSEALPLFVSSLHIYETLNNHYGMATSLTGMGLIYQTRKQYQEAINLHKKAASHARRINSDDRLGVIYFNTGLAYDERGLYDSAVYYLDLSLRYNKKVNDHRVIAMGYNRIGEVSYHQQNYVRAEENYKKALHYQEFKSDWENCFALAGLAQTYAALNKYDDALDAGLKSYAIARDINAKWEIERITRILAEIYAKQKQFDKAYSMTLVNRSYSDSIFNEQKEKEMNFILLKQNELENLKLKGESALQQSLLRQKDLQIIIAVLAGLVFLMMALALYFQHRQNKNRNRVLSMTNEKIERQKEALISINQTKNQLFSIVSHDMRSPFATLHGLLELAKDDGLDKETQKKFFNDVQNAMKSVSNSLESLLRWANSQMEGLHPEPVSMDIDKIMEAKISFWKVQAAQKEIVFEHHPMNYAVYADLDQIKTVLRNLIGNAIKFTPNSGTVRISYTLKDDYVGIHIQDNGIGMSSEIISHLFKFNRQNQRRGTDRETGTGIGLMISKEFIEHNKGRITVKSQPGHGSTFTVWLPVWKNPDLKN